MICTCVSREVCITYCISVTVWLSRNMCMIIAWLALTRPCFSCMCLSRGGFVFLVWLMQSVKYICFLHDVLYGIAWLLYQSISIAWFLFFSRDACISRDVLLSAHQLVIPGSSEEMSKFQEDTTSSSRVHLECTFPKIDINLHTKNVFELIYNRWAGHILEN